MHKNIDANKMKQCSCLKNSFMTLSTKMQVLGIEECQCPVPKNSSYIWTSDAGEERLGCITVR